MRYTDILRNSDTAPDPEPKGRAVPFADAGGIQPEPPPGTNRGLTERLFPVLSRTAGEVADAIQQGRPIPLDAVRKAIAACVREIGNSEARITPLAPPCNHAYYVRNLTLNALCSLQLGRGLGFPKEKMEDLGLAAILHDVGIFRVPAEVLLASRALSASERDLVERHPVLGSEMLKPFEKDFPWLPLIPLQEHEREKGLGYPKQINASETHEYARIVGMVDVYEAILNTRPYRPARLPDQALREIIMLQDANGYPRDLVRVLIQEFTLFPIGARVRLSSGETAAVGQVHPLSPFSPTVEILEGTRKGTTLDLSHDPLIFVQEALAG